MVVASFGSVLITTVGTIFLYKQIVLTREAVEDTGKATAAMERQNELVAQQQRPWLTIDLSEPFISRNANGMLLFCNVELGNIGQTPAFEARVRHALAPPIRNPIHDFEIISENVADEMPEMDLLSERMVVLPKGKAVTQIIIGLERTDPRNTLNDGVIPTFMVWVNYSLADGTTGHSSAWFTIGPAPEGGEGPNIILWDQERIEGDEPPLKVTPYGYVRVT